MAGVAEIEVAPAEDGQTVEQLLDRAFTEYRVLDGKVRDERGRIRPHVKVFVNGQDATRGEGLATVVPAGARVHIINAVSGGLTRRCRCGPSGLRFGADNTGTAGHARNMSSAAREKTLILMRHSKAEQSPGKVDHDRELTERGRRDANAAGAWLKEQGLVPDLVICSTSRRTRQTWEAACKGGAHTEFVEYRKSIYTGGTEETLETIREDAGETASVLIIGHNPTIAS